MRIAHLGHSCILVEIDATTILFDPGMFSHGFEGITGLDAIVVTHQHPDHIDVSRIEALVEANPTAKLLSDPQTAAQQGGPWEAVHAGDVLTVGRGENTVHVTGGGGQHAVIHPDIPVIDNTVFQLGTPDDPSQLVHPGDSLWVPPTPVGVLALPTVAPWMKISETIDYLRAVAPRTAFPIHQGIITEFAHGGYYGRFTDMAAPSTEFRTLKPELAEEF